MLDKSENTVVSLQVARFGSDDVKCLITCSPARKGDPIWILVGECKNRSKYTIEQDGKHYVDEYVMFMNHSCDPNCKIENRVIFAIKDIASFEQLTFDYNTTESNIAESFQCGCGSANCRGKVI